MYASQRIEKIYCNALEKFSRQYKIVDKHGKIKRMALKEKQIYVNKCFYDTKTNKKLLKYIFPII